MKAYITKIYLGVIAIALMSSCTKTKYEKTKLPYNEIKRFAIKGFIEGDSILGAISGNEISIYWDQTIALPSNIKPAINLSEGAKVSPASGEEVAINNTNSFLVTAEDGTTRNYNLKFIFQQPAPIVNSAPNATWLRWGPSQNLNLLINGQYFLSAGGPSTIRVFARRSSDGFEFDLPVDLEKVKSTVIICSLPEYTPSMNFGAHDIKLTVGNKTVDVAKGYIGPHKLVPSYFKMELPTAKQIKAGDEIRYRLNDGDLNGIATKNYAGKCTEITVLATGTGTNSNDYRSVIVKEFSQVGNTISFKFPLIEGIQDSYYIRFLQFTFPGYGLNNAPDEVTAIEYASESDRIYITR